MGKKNLRPLRCLVTAQTAWNLKRLANMAGISPGRVVDKLVREKMLALREPPGPWPGQAIRQNGSRQK